MSLKFKSHGKLLITGEYFVLKGAQSLCIPTKFFQTLKIKDSKEKNLVWKSFDHNNERLYFLKRSFFVQVGIVHVFCSGRNCLPGQVWTCLPGLFD